MTKTPPTYDELDATFAELDARLEAHKAPTPMTNETVAAIIDIRMTLIARHQKLWVESSDNQSIRDYCVREMVVSLAVIEKWMEVKFLDPNWEPPGVIYLDDDEQNGKNDD